jgi:hypothetical protein
VPSRIREPLKNLKIALLLSRFSSAYTASSALFNSFQVTRSRLRLTAAPSQTSVRPRRSFGGAGDAEYAEGEFFRGSLDRGAIHPLLI